MVDPESRPFGGHPRDGSGPGSDGCAKTQVGIDVVGNPARELLQVSCPGDDLDGSNGEGPQHRLRLGSLHGEGPQHRLRLGSLHGAGRLRTSLLLVEATLVGGGLAGTGWRHRSSVARTCIFCGATPKQLGPGAVERL